MILAETVPRKCEEKTPGLKKRPGVSLALPNIGLRGSCKGKSSGLGQASICYTTTLGEEGVGSYHRLFLAKHYSQVPYARAKIQVETAIQDLFPSLISESSNNKFPRGEQH